MPGRGLSSVKLHATHAKLMFLRSLADNPWAHHISAPGQLGYDRRSEVVKLSAPWCRHAWIRRLKGPLSDAPGYTDHIQPGAVGSVAVTSNRKFCKSRYHKYHRFQTSTSGKSLPERMCDQTARRCEVSTCCVPESIALIGYYPEGPNCDTQNSSRLTRVRPNGYSE